MTTPPDRNYISSLMKVRFCPIVTLGRGSPVDKAQGDCLVFRVPSERLPPVVPWADDPVAVDKGCPDGDAFLLPDLPRLLDGRLCDFVHVDSHEGLRKTACPP